MRGKKGKAEERKGDIYKWRKGKARKIEEQVLNTL